MTKEVRGKNEGLLRPPIIDTDPHFCFVDPKHVVTSKVEVPKDHGAQASGKFVATIGDETTCPEGGKATVATGATDYKLEDQPVARLNDMSDHTKLPPVLAVFGIPSDSSLVSTTSDFFIGGGTTVGNHKKAKEICEQMEAGRQGQGLKGPGRQRYNNCGPECVRMVTNAQRARQNPPGTPLTEDEVLYRGFSSGMDGSTDYSRKNPRTGKEELVHFKDDGSCNKLKQAYEDSKAGKGNPYAQEVEAARAERDAAATANNLEPNNTNQEKLNKAEEKLAAAEAKQQGYFQSEEYKSKHQSISDAYWKCRDDQYKKFYGTGNAKNVYGTTGPDTREKILQSYGVETTRVDSDANSTASAVAQGKGVIVPMNDIKDETDPTGNAALEKHIIVVTGHEYDENGKLVAVRYNDPYNGCGKSMPADEYEAKRQKSGEGKEAQVTKEKCW